MKNSLNKAEKGITALFILGMLGVLIIFLMISITKQGKIENEKQENYTDISALWTLDKEGTQPVNVKELGKHMDPVSGVLSIYYQLPEMSSDVCLIYRSKDVYTRVLIDGECVYETSVYESKYYNKSPGNLWNIVMVNSRYSRSCLEIEISMVYDTNAITVDSLLLGDKADIILGLVYKNIFGIVVSLLLILLGVVLIIVDVLPTYAHSKKHHGLFWVGLFAVLTGVWSLIETNVLQFCVNDMRILQLIGNIIMTIDSMPLLMYLNCEYKIFKYSGMRILALVNSIYILICVAVQLSGIGDWHHMLNVSTLLMIVTDTLLTVWVAYLLIKLKKRKKPIFNCALQLLGFTALWGLVIFEGIRSLQVDRIDRAGLVRVGMMILCACLATSNQIDTYKVLEQGLKYDLISKLAYSDGLTGVGNRTAYLEQIEEYSDEEKNFMQLGIVYLDVNNLKMVNDNQGHEYGDELIMSAARIIEDSFGHFGMTYRIGGDEFCVLMSGTNLNEKYEEGLEIFNQLLDEANKEKWYSYPIQIAHGFAICEEFSREKIDETVTQADSEMYKNKLELKKIKK